MATMTQELIVVEQLPVITERLKMVAAEIDQRTADVLSMVFTEETVKTAKKLRADLNKEHAALEWQRKTVKSAIMAPYDAFETVFKQQISDKYKAADAHLKQHIDTVERELKQRKTDDLKLYFDEYCLSRGIDFVSMETWNPNVTLSVSLKKLKEEAKTFIDRVCDDLALIETQEHKAEILVEYRRTLNCSQAIATVVERHRAMSEEAARQAELEQRKAAERDAVARVEEAASLAPPVEEEAPQLPVDDDPILTVPFNVTARRSKLIALRQYMIDDGGYQYE